MPFVCVFNRSIWLFATLFPLVLARPAAARDLYAAPTARADADGTRPRPLSLEAAIARAQAGDRVKITAGTYTVAAPIDVRPGVAVEGDDPKNRPVLNATFGSEDSDAIHIDDFTHIAEFGGLIQIFYADWALNRGIFNVDKAQNNAFRHLILDGGRYTQRPGSDFGAAAGIRIRTANDAQDFRKPGHPIEGNCTVSHSVFRNIRGAGVLFCGGQGHAAHHCAFVSCGYGEGDTQGGDPNHASSGALTSEMAQNCAYHHNTFVSSKRPEGFGIKVGGHYNKSIKIYENDFRLYDTQAYHQGDPNFDIEVISNYHTDIEIYQNTFRGVISLVLGDPKQRVFWVHDNRWRDVNGNNGNGYDWGIELGTSHCLIENNTFQGSGRFITDFGSDNVDITLSRNTIVGASALIDLNGAYRNLTVVGNTITLGESETVEGYEKIPSSLFRYGYRAGSKDWLVKDNTIVGPKRKDGAATAFLNVHRGAKAPTAVRLINNRLVRIDVNRSDPGPDKEAHP
jgi:hypothetical protein